MRKIYLIILLLPFFGYTYNTPQSPDLLIYKGDTIALYRLLLENYISESINSEKIRENIKDAVAPNTACWHGYRTLYEIRNDSLFLIKAYGKNDIDLSEIFDKKTHIFMDWVTGIVTSMRNNIIYDHGHPWGGFFEYETDFKFEKGMLKSVQEYHNYLQPSEYTDNSTVIKFIADNINYNNVKTPDKKARVIISIDDVDADGKITRVSVVRGVEGYNEEAMRVIRSIPRWQVIIRRGMKEHIRWYMPVNFDKKE